MAALAQSFADKLSDLWGPSYLSLAISLVVAAYVAQTIQHALFSPLARIPGPLINKFTNLPFVYHLFTGQIHSYSCKLHDQYGEVVRIGIDQVSLSNPSDTRLILATHAFPKSPLYEKGKVIDINMFSTADPELNKTRRRQLGGAFSMASLRDVEDVTMEVGVKSLMRAWDAAIERNGKTACINYFYMFHYMTFDTIGLLAFGRSFDILETGNTEIIDWFKDIFRFKNVVRIFPIVRHIPWLYPKLKKSRYNLIRIIRNAIAARRQLISETGIPPRIDIMQKFIDAVDPATGDKLTETQLLSELITMLVAGTDTTATTLSWTIMHMLNNPHVYRRVTDEVRSQFPDTSKPIVFGEAKSKLPYLSAVLQESMRLTSVSSGLTPRTLPRDGTTIQGYFMPHGTHIALTFAACHHNASVWKHPDTFDPERFLGKDADENAKSVLTFSTGVRICAGRNLALVEMYTTLANILRRYNISLPSDSPYGPHRKDERGAPITIPGKSDGVYGPENPKVNCLINISLA